MTFKTKDGYDINGTWTEPDLHLYYLIKFNGVDMVVSKRWSEIITKDANQYYRFKENAEKALAEIKENQAGKKVFKTKDGFEVRPEHAGHSIAYIHSPYINSLTGRAEIRTVYLSNVKTEDLHKWYWLEANAQKERAELEASQVYKTKDVFEIKPEAYGYLYKVYRRPGISEIQYKLICDVNPKDIPNWYWLHANALAAKEKLDAEYESVPNWIKNIGENIGEKFESNHYSDALRYSLLGSWNESKKAAAEHDKKLIMVKESPTYEEYQQRLIDDKKLLVDKKRKIIMDFIDKHNISFSVSIALLFILDKDGTDKADLEKAAWYLQRAIDKL